MKLIRLNLMLVICLFMIICFFPLSQLYAQHTIPNWQVHTHTDEHEGGKMFVGGALTYWNDTDEKTITFDFCPEIGYLFGNNWGIGLMLGYAYEKTTNNAVVISSQGIKLAPFARYYYLHRGPFNLYIDGGLGVDWYKEKNKQTNESGKQHGWEVGIRPGACVDLTEGLCLCLRMGFIGYRNHFTMGEEEQIGNNGFGLRFAPEELMIGLELEF